MHETLPGSPNSRLDSVEKSGRKNRLAKSSTLAGGAIELRDSARATFYRCFYSARFEAFRAKAISRVRRDDFENLTSARKRPDASDSFENGFHREKKKKKTKEKRIADEPARSIDVRAVASRIIKHFSSVRESNYRGTPCTDTGFDRIFVRRRGS